MAARTKKFERPKPPSKSAFSGIQLSLFQNFLCNTEEERTKLSNTIELWDGVPKYFVSRKEMNDLRENGFLPTLERSFHYKGRTLTVTIYPARLKDKDGKPKEFYPSAREELIEDALRKTASEQNFGFYEDKSENRRSGVVFSLHMLRKELALRGHTLSYQQVVESLQILARSNIEICSPDGDRFFESSILPILAGVSRIRPSGRPKVALVCGLLPLGDREYPGADLSAIQLPHHDGLQLTPCPLVA